MPAIRTFIALPLSTELQRALERTQRALAKRATAVRWVNASHIHLTLKFLGALPRQQVPAVAAALDRVAGRHGDFDVAAEGVGAFPGTHSPKVIWAGVRQNTHLEHLQRDLENELSLLGIARETRPFAPHLTLGRLRDGRHRRACGNALQSCPTTELPACRAGRLVLYHSDLRPTGPVYTELHSAALLPSAV